ncbi:olfactory receptor 5AP2-like [Pelobates fuscus]|uniref:olfactory receptor 5AP2-like n=1 Tax=Pelobates fuscus TaxID=191477 RepID=UPI002FE4ECBE
MKAPEATVPLTECAPKVKFTPANANNHLFHRARVGDEIEIENNNSRVIYEFNLLGLSNFGEYQIPMSIFFFIINVLTIFGNLFIFDIIRRDRSLHNPMYFFLSHLSFLDMTSSCIILPKMLANYLTNTRSISYVGCLIQLYFFITFLATECFLLTTMAYDRYVAICNPLCYALIMNSKLCIVMAVCSWMFGLMYAMLHTILIARLDFCHCREITNYFCDLPPLLRISCTNILQNIVLIFLGGVLIGVNSLIFTLLSYIHIMLSILRIHSVKGRYKAFSTCASHIIVFTLFISSLVAVYFQPVSTYSLYGDRLLSLVYTVLTPLLNPLIYCIRNADVKKAIGKMLSLQRQRMCLIIAQSRAVGKLGIADVCLY